MAIRGLHRLEAGENKSNVNVTFESDDNAISGNKPKVVAISNDGMLAVMFSDDHLVSIWDVTEARLFRALNRIDDVLSGMAIGDDGRTIALGTVDGQIIIRHLLPRGQNLVDLAKDLAPRCLTRLERKKYYLPEHPPLWCMEQQIWPYHPIGG